MADIKQRFAKVNAFIIERGGWVVSIPGAPEVIFEALPESALPEDLIAMGHDIGPADPPQTMRILAHAIRQRLTLTSCGIFEELTEGSTKPIAETRTHAGIVRVVRYTFSLL
jgi:hypothetical protein